MQNITLDSLVVTLGQIIADFGMKLLAAIVIWTVGFWIVKKVISSLSYGMQSHKVDPSLTSFTLSFLSITLKAFVIIIILTTLGVQMTSIVAVLGAASLAVGMSLSGTLQNFAGGMVLLVFKPFRVGDAIITADGKTGVVKKITIFTTQINTFDNQVLFLPNGALSNGVITNLSMGGKRRTDLSVGISYGDDVEKARKLALKILSKDKRVLKDPVPTVFLSSLDDSAVTLIIRYWTSFEDLYPTQADILETIYKEFPKNNLNFPFPQMDVHVKKN
ncbi:MAG: mechanosensitive ion channel [Alphaproteobacteria bacterium]|nr:mechanosensitive ion channel [Alphaproteobacteria bacterium]